MSDDPASVQAFQDELRTMQKLAVRLDRYERFFCAALTGMMADKPVREQDQAIWIESALRMTDRMEEVFEKHWNEKMKWEERIKNVKR
jgi:hypothetical protein